MLLATDIEVDVNRFAGKRVFRCGTGVALKQPEATLDRALQEAAVLGGGVTASAATGEQKAEKTGVYKHLLTGVSYMLPMVVAGGLLIALSFVFGIEAFKRRRHASRSLDEDRRRNRLPADGAATSRLHRLFHCRPPGPGARHDRRLAGRHARRGFGGIIAGFVAGYAAKAVSRWIPLPASIESPRRS